MILSHIGFSRISMQIRTIKVGFPDLLGDTIANPIPTGLYIYRGSVSYRVVHS